MKNEFLIKMISISRNHQLWPIEEFFKINKNNLKMRSIDFFNTDQS